MPVHSILHQIWSFSTTESMQQMSKAYLNTRHAHTQRYAIPQVAVRKVEVVSLPPRRWEHSIPGLFLSWKHDACLERDVTYLDELLHKRLTVRKRPMLHTPSNLQATIALSFAVYSKRQLRPCAFVYDNCLMRRLHCPRQTGTSWLLHLFRGAESFKAAQLCKAALGVQAPSTIRHVVRDSTPLSANRTRSQVKIYKSYCIVVAGEVWNIETVLSFGYICTHADTAPDGHPLGQPMCLFHPVQKTKGPLSSPFVALTALLSSPFNIVTNSYSISFSGLCCSCGSL